MADVFWGRSNNLVPIPGEEYGLLRLGGAGDSLKLIDS